MTTLEVVSNIRLRTGFFKIYESVDRLDVLEMENRILKQNIKASKEDTA